MTATLADIRTKVRRLTRNPTEQQLTTTELDNYINTFVLYDFPEHVKLFSLRETFSFWTTPYIDVYDSTNTLYDPNTYTTIVPPIYIAGYQSMFSQSRDQFFRNYPMTNFEETIGTGDGATTAFNFTLSNIPVLRNEVTISSEDAGGNRLTAVDDGAGNLVNKDTVGALGANIGTINYTTGVIAITWLVAPANAEPVIAQTVPYAAARPQAMLFFDNQFTLRPVPDDVYKVNMEVYRVPTQLLAVGDRPEIDAWWQYIAYGAAKKIFEDRMDLESVSSIMPEMNQQQRLALRRTIVQQTNDRTATIFSESLDYPYSFNNTFGGF